MFVHGQFGDTSDFTDNGIGGLEGLPQRIGAIPGSYVNALFPYDNKKGQWVTDPSIGQALADYITCTSAASLAAGGTGKVIVITHSMGGLAIRQAATLTGSNGMPTSNALGLVITIAPPNTGSWADGVFHDARNGTAGVDISTLTWILQGVCGAVRHNGQLCGLVQGATSESGTAMVPGSAQLAALAPPPTSVPLDAVAGQLTITSTLFHHTYTVAPAGSIGDLLVKPDSALQYGTRRGSNEILDQCTMSVHEVWDTAGWGGCTHGGLLYDATLGQHVYDWVKAWIDGHPAPTPPPTTTPRVLTPQPSPPTIPLVVSPVCRDFVQMSDQAEDYALRQMMTAHHDTSDIGLTRLSVAAFCALFPGRRIDGVYSG